MSNICQALTSVRRGARSGSGGGVVPQGGRADGPKGDDPPGRLLPRGAGRAARHARRRAPLPSGRTVHMWCFWFFPRSVSYLLPLSALSYVSIMSPLSYRLSHTASLISSLSHLSQVSPLPLISLLSLSCLSSLSDISSFSFLSCSLSSTKLAGELSGLIDTLVSAENNVTWYVRPWRAAAERGHARGQHAFAMCCALGQGTAQAGSFAYTPGAYTRPLLSST